MFNFKSFYTSIKEIIYKNKESCIVVAIYVFALFLFFKDHLTNYYIAGDFLAYWVPYYHFIISSIKEGTLPLWQPYSVMGVPGIFQPGATFFYPLLWLLFGFNLIFNPDLSINLFGKSLIIYQYAHILIGMLGIYFLLKNKLKLSLIASAIGGIIYGLSIATTASLGDVSGLLGKMYFPIIIYALLNFLEKPNFFKAIFLILVNYCILSFGYPYFYLYFFSAEIALALFFGFKSFIKVGVLIGISLLISAYFLFPQANIYQQSHRFNITKEGSNFHTQSSFAPPRITNIIIPQYFGELFDRKDPQLIFSHGNLYWGIFPLIFLLYGFATLTKNSFNSWLVGVFVIGIVYSLGGYLNVPGVLSTVIGLVDQLRSHTQILVITFFAGVVILSQGIDKVTDGYKNKSLEILLSIIFAVLLMVLIFIPLFCIQCLTDSQDILINFSKLVIILGLSLLLFYLYTRNGNKLFIILGVIITFFEFSTSFNNFNYLKYNVSYSDYYKRNILIPEIPTTTNLFRYSFEEDQFSYNTLYLKIFSTKGYEGIPYSASSTINRFEEDKVLKFLNVKYLVTTRSNLDKKYPSLKLIRTIIPSEHPKETLISSVPNMPFWTNQSTNTHYIYQIDGYLPRFFVPEKVLSCLNGECYQKEDISNIIYTKEPNIDISNPEKDSVKIETKEYSANKIILLITTDSETFIGSSEIWDAGWKIKINNEQNNIYNINNGFRGFKVEKGRSEVIMYYIPPYLIEGCIISLLGLSLLGLIYYKRKYIQKW